MTKNCVPSSFLKGCLIEWMHGPLTRYAELRVAHGRECRERFPRHRLQRNPLVSDPVMDHGPCVTHVPWCMSGSLVSGCGEKFPAFPAHAQPVILRIRQEAHGGHRDTLGVLDYTWQAPKMSFHADGVTLVADLQYNLLEKLDNFASSLMWSCHLNSNNIYMTEWGLLLWGVGKSIWKF